ncbi:MAG TPA: hypothetical protein VKU02_09675 [Gemmataceae bacterium]|nr:hypothetical protein [Gemmataceae bacterium]
MCSRWLKQTGIPTLLFGFLTAAIIVPAVEAEFPPGRTVVPCVPAPLCPPAPPCPTPVPPTMVPQPAEPQTQQPSQQPQPAPPTPPAPEPTLPAEQAAATGTAQVALAAPNMIGNLLGAGRSLSFFYQRSSGSVFINGTGSTNVVNPKVADNNSPLPEDRVYFRYNYFNDAQKVTGDSGKVIFDPTLGVSQFSAPRFRGITTTRSYDVHDFTFGGEKTYLDGRFSVELRVPFSTTLAHSQDLRVANVTGIGTDVDGDSNSSIIQTTATPQNTLGRTDTEFGNMTVVLKGLAYQSSKLAISSGASIGIPTAPDTRVRVTDFLGDGFDNDIEIQRQREFRISNDTWAISPFLAALVTPTDRLFAQGFLQFDFPVNRSTISYSELALINTEPAELALDPLVVTDRIREQSLMQMDLGLGYWLVKDQCRSWIQGIAPTLELHYTTTLDNADIRTLPTATKSPTLQVVGPNGALIPEPHPTVGNLRNRVDILDMTVGTTFLVANRATVATGFAFPLKTGDDRTFSWEFQLQINYYFGGPRNRSSWAPSF